MNKKLEKQLLDELIKNHFPNIGGYENLSPKQKDFIGRIIRGKDVMGLMPTGGGKSVCYQLPALFFEDSITIVISPLVALIKDQVEGINQNEEVAVAFNSIFDKSKYDDSRLVADDVVDGKYRMIYMAPESLQTISFLRLERRIRDRIKFVAIDEAHCVSTWGYSFRPAYRNILAFIKSLPKRPVIAAFTATATKFIVKDIVKTLELKVPEIDERMEFARDDLHLKFVKCSANKMLNINTPEEHRQRAIYNEVKKHIDKGEKGIIYCASEVGINDIKGYLYSNKNHRRINTKIATYYGQMSQKEKNDNYISFKEGNSLLMIATNAFGMGININDIVYVIHFNMPQSIENYYQEVGRAARDRNLEGYGTLYYVESDYDLNLNIISKPERGVPNGKFRQAIARGRLDDMSRFVRRNFSRDESVKTNAQSNILFNKTVEEKINKDITDYYNDDKLSVTETYINTILENYDEQENVDDYLELVARVKLAEKQKMNVRKDTSDNQEEPSDKKPTKRIETAVRVPVEDYLKPVDDNPPLFINCTLVANEIRKGRALVGEPNIRTFRGTKRYKEDTGICVTFTIDKKLSYFDMMIADAIYSLWIQGEPIYVKTIWGILCGKKEVSIKNGKGEKEGEGKRKIIEDSIARLSDTHIKIVYDKKDNYGIRFADESNLRVLEGCFMQITRTADFRYVMDDNKLPPLYHYAEIQNQFQCISSRWLDLKSIPSSIENVLLVYYFVQRLDLMPKPGIDNKLTAVTEREKRSSRPMPRRRKDVLSNKISYILTDKSTLFDMLGINMGTDKYLYKRKYEDLCGVPEIKDIITDENGKRLAKKQKQQIGKIEKIFKEYKKNRIIVDYKSVSNKKNSVLYDGKEIPLKYTGIVIDNYTADDKEKYSIAVNRYDASSE